MSGLLLKYLLKCIVTLIAQMQRGKIIIPDLKINMIIYSPSPSSDT